MHRWFPKPAPWRDEQYLAFVRDHGCIGCSHPRPNEAHHYMEGMSGVARKVDDFFTLPLCRDCHQAWHQQAYLPCYEWRRAGQPATPGDKDAFSIAHERSRAAMYQSEAKLLAEWLRIVDADTVRPPPPDEDDRF